MRYSADCPGEVGRCVQHADTIGAVATITGLYSLNLGALMSQSMAQVELRLARSRRNDGARRVGARDRGGRIAFAVHPMTSLAYRRRCRGSCFGRRDSAERERDQSCKCEPEPRSAS